MVHIELHSSIIFHKKHERICFYWSKNCFTDKLKYTIGYNFMNWAYHIKLSKNVSRSLLDQSIHESLQSHTNSGPVYVDRFRNTSFGEQCDKWLNHCLLWTCIFDPVPCNFVSYSLGAGITVFIISISAAIGAVIIIKKAVKTQF